MLLHFGNACFRIGERRKGIIVKEGGMLCPMTKIKKAEKGCSDWLLMGAGFTSLLSGFLYLPRCKEKNISVSQAEMGHCCRIVGSLRLHHLLGDRKSLALVKP